MSTGRYMSHILLTWMGQLNNIVVHTSNITTSATSKHRSRILFTVYTRENREKAVVISMLKIIILVLAFWDCKVTVSFLKSA